MVNFVSTLCFLIAFTFDKRLKRKEDNRKTLIRQKLEEISQLDSDFSILSTRLEKAQWYDVAAVERFTNLYDYDIFGEEMPKSKQCSFRSTRRSIIKEKEILMMMPGKNNAS